MSQKTTPGSVGAQATVKRRVPFWDNARFACMVLVVLGHAVQRLTYDSEIAFTIYLLIFAFHMPAFAIISGYFSKSDPPSRLQMARVITDILVPYIIFESLWTLTKWLVEGRLNPDITQPSWTLWFLLALGIFRLVLPYLALLKWPLLWAIVISVGAGYIPAIGSTFSLARTLGLLPFFVLGWWLKEHGLVDRLRLLARPWWAVAAAVAIFVVAGVALWTGTDTWRAIDLSSWLYYKANYASIGGTEWWAGGVRLALMAVAVLLSAAFFVLLPRRSTWWTHFGQYTMYVYLLHTFVLYPFRQFGLLRGLEPMWLWLPVVVVASVLIAVALASRPVRRLFRPLIEPRPTWLFGDPQIASREGHRSDPTGSRRTTEPPRGRSDQPQNG